MWKVVTSSNLNPPLKLFFYSPILTNKNLLLKIYCENIVVMFLNQDFLFFILFLLSLISFHPYVFSFFLFFFLFFSSTHVVISLSPLLLFSFSPSFKNIPTLATLVLAFFFSFFFFSPALSLYFFFFFYLIPEHSSPTKSR